MTRDRRKLMAGTEPPDRGPGQAAAPLRSLDYVVVDIETTGGSWERGHRILEVAAIRVAWPGRIVDEFSTLLNPGRPIPRGVSRLTHITRDMIADSPRFDHVARRLFELINGRVFVAHNVPFDWRFLDAEFERLWIPPLECRRLCTLRLARRLVPELGRRSLDDLCTYFGIENEARHRATGDARATVQLLDCLAERLEERGIDDWHAVERLLEARGRRRKRTALPTSIDLV